MAARSGNGFEGPVSPQRQFQIGRQWRSNADFDLHEAGKHVAARLSARILKVAIRLSTPVGDRHKMECVYINLESQNERRSSIENNFKQVRGDGWNLSRFDAIDTAWIAAQQVQGAARPSEKGCFISHRNLIHQNLSHDGLLMVLEDDAVFGVETCKAIDMSLANTNEADWDIIFTDICVPNVGNWPDLIRLRRKFEQTKTLSLLSLAQFAFAGSTSYILNHRSKHLLAGLLNGVDRIDAPYDIYLRWLVQRNKLKGFVIFPFVTSISDLADRTSVQVSDDVSSNLIWNVFRRTVWMERDLNQAIASILPIHKAYSDPETFLFGTLFEALLSDKIQR